ncbi:MAG: hypothetical protein K2I87_07585 [Bacteroidales bacterium]|nr:hypothetical protein [Bacteroidales bacterium]
MTQLVLNIENPDILPRLRSVLSGFRGVSISESVQEDDRILKSIETAYEEVCSAREQGKSLGQLDELIAELKG